MKNIPDEKLQNPIIQNILSTTNTFTQSPYGRNDDLINVEAVTQEGYKKFHSYVIALNIIEIRFYADSWLMFSDFLKLASIKDAVKLQVLPVNELKSNFNHDMYGERNNDQGIRNVPDVPLMLRVTRMGK